MLDKEPSPSPKKNSVKWNKKSTSPHVIRIPPNTIHNADSLILADEHAQHNILTSYLWYTRRNKLANGSGGEPGSGWGSLRSKPTTKRTEKAFDRDLQVRRMMEAESLTLSLTLTTIQVRQMMEAERLANEERMRLERERLMREREQREEMERSITSL